ncbi:hypothetical protein BCR33DRAFT_720610 [Rhizoclosmatium globosum]|uniref:IMD domain-containing protein n=1 Tax=Rhizoclosmatium globosum TaxID=329046 RepID=A0A1Y2BUY6_9FUNG|nr:hypothetical protein BCR33DRAFT_720610 [Rhizoclosmatium globosum]|eukprot:ORY38570.1 hypothetical protein BCR33DRAFT_720610 [Rhizoclosmatium globosum]
MTELLHVRAEPIATLSRADSLPRSLSQSKSATKSIRSFASSGSNGEKAPIAVSFAAFSTFAGSLAAFKGAVAGAARAGDSLANAAEEVARQLENSGNTYEPDAIRDINALIDTSHLLANALQAWSESLGSDVVNPLAKHLGDISATVKAKQNANNGRINDLVQKLKAEEEHSYRLGKKNMRDVASLHESLNLRVTLTEEINRLNATNAQMPDVFASNSVELLLSCTSAAAFAQLEAIETIKDGVKTIDSVVDSVDYQRKKLEAMDSIIHHLTPAQSVAPASSTPPPPDVPLPVTTPQPRSSSPVPPAPARTTSNRAKSPNPSPLKPTTSTPMLQISQPQQQAPPKKLPFYLNPSKPTGQLTPPTSPPTISQPLTVETPESLSRDAIVQRYMDEESELLPTDSVSNVAPREPEEPVGEVERPETPSMSREKSRGLRFFGRK